MRNIFFRFMFVVFFDKIKKDNVKKIKTTTLFYILIKHTVLNQDICQCFFQLPSFSSTPSEMCHLGYVPIALSKAIEPPRRCAIQAEAITLWRASLMVIDKGIISCVFYTLSNTLRWQICQSARSQVRDGAIKDSLTPCCYHEASYLSFASNLGTLFNQSRFLNCSDCG